MLSLQRSESPQGFWQGLEDEGVSKAYIVVSVKEAWQFDTNVQVIPPLVHEGLR